MVGGSRVDEIKYFDEEDEAKAFVAKFNAKSNKDAYRDGLNPGRRKKID